MDSRRLNHHHPQAIVIPPKWVKISQCPKQVWMPQSFITNTSRNFLVSTHLLRASWRLNQLHPQPLGVFLRQPHPVPKPWGNPKLNWEKNPTTRWLSRNGKARMKPLSHLKILMPMTRKEPITQIHVPCIHKPARKSHMQPTTGKSSCWSFLIQPSLLVLSFPCPSFAFLFPMLECSKITLSVQ